MKIYEGQFKFGKRLSPGQLISLSKLLVESSQDGDKQESFTGDYYGGFMLNDDLTGLSYNGNKSPADVAEILFAVIEEMREEYSDFELEGQLTALDDKIPSYAEIRVKYGNIVVVTKALITCPNCGLHMTLAATDQVSIQLGPPYRIYS